MSDAIALYLGASVRWPNVRSFSVHILRRKSSVINLTPAVVPPRPECNELLFLVEIEICICLMNEARLFLRNQFFLVKRTDGTWMYLYTSCLLILQRGGCLYVCRR